MPHGGHSHHGDFDQTTRPWHPDSISSSALPIPSKPRMITMPLHSRSVAFLFLYALGALNSNVLRAAPVQLVKDRQPLAKIYFSPSEAASTPSQNGSKLLPRAIEDLNDHLEKMTGTRLDVITAFSPGEIAGTAIVLGALAEKCGSSPPPTKFRQSVRIRASGNRIFIAGERESATVNGIYTLLESLGCDWVMPGSIGDIIPSSPDLAVNETDRTEMPSFSGRNLWYRAQKQLCTEQDEEEFALWCRRQRLDAPGETPDLGAGHVWGGFITRHRQEFDQDPSMFALTTNSEGALERRGPQIESTHPRVIDLFVQDISDTFIKNGWPNDKVVSFSIGPADGLDFSVSSEAIAAGSGRTDPMIGVTDVTDLCIKLGNEILGRVETEYPNVSLGFYSYSAHGSYPLKHKPHPRLNQIFAPISFSRYHSPLSPNSKTWPYYVNIVERWSALAKAQGNQLSYRGYNWNLAENMIPFSKLQIFGEEIPWYHTKGFVAVNIEATKAWAVNGPSDYLLAKLLWNSAQDWRSILKDYCRKSFGEGASDMETYLLDLTNRQTEAGQEAGSFHAIHLIYDSAFVARSREHLERAIARAQRPEEKTRASYFLYPLEQLDLYLQFRERFIHYDFSAAKQLLSRIKACWEKAYARNTQIVAKEAPAYLARYFEDFVEKGLAFTSKPYALEMPLPDKLATQFDPTSVGEQMGFQNPSLNDALFLRTRTWSATWDAQGLGAMRSGSVWYRFRFQSPRGLADKHLYLFVGGADDKTEAWLNNVYLGSSPPSYCTPHIFDLTQALYPKAENVLAIKVSRHSPINEIGLGGIIRPSFLFSGPKLKPSVPAASAPTRVLPGGDLSN